MTQPPVLTKEQLARFHMPFQEMMEQFGYARTEAPKSAGVGGISGKIFDGLVTVETYLTDTGDQIVETVENVAKWAYDHFQFFYVCCKFLRGIGALLVTILVMLLCLKFIYICSRKRRPRYQNISWNQPRGKQRNDALITSYDVE